MLDSSNLDNTDKDSSWRELIGLLRTTPTVEGRRRLCLEASELIDGAADGSCSFVADDISFNRQRFLNRHFIYVNQKMAFDGIYLGCFISTESGYRRTKQNHPKLFRLYNFFDFLWHRACPKLVLTQRFYFSIYKQVKRSYPKPEVFGRLSYCGFDILHSEVVGDFTFVVCRKKRLPSTDEHPSYKLLISLRRVGKNGKRIRVYKFRTMYAYSEYLQQYVYEHNALDKNGKFANDFRVSGWGKLLRKYWLDELPMVWNILKGDMKLIGVRPLSEQYYSLYTPEMQQYRILCKPGLLPPYYADMPEGIEEVQQSEKKYLDVFFQNPFRTQWVYFWKIMCSIFVKRHHSQ